MKTLQNKIDFAVIIRVNGANPNGDPLNENRPRMRYDGRGEITDICIKRKIRDRLAERGESIFVQSLDGHTSLKARLEATFTKEDFKDIEALREKECAQWLDVRAFGQLIAFGNISHGIRGPVTIRTAQSVAPIDVISTQITRSIMAEKPNDTMGMKHAVDKAVYVVYGSMYPTLAERTGFTDEDAQKIKKVLPIMFEGDASAARPAGSMEVATVIWWDHGCPRGRCGSAAVHSSLTVKNDGTYALDDIGVPFEEIDGF